VNIVSFDQWLLDTSLNTPVDGLGNRARYRLLRGIRRLRLLISDPRVTFSLREYNLRLPLSHELPFYRRNFPDYAANLGRVSFYARHKYPDLTMIDVGANIGDSVAIVRGYGDIPVLCLEGEPRFFRLLKENTRNLPTVEIEQTFIGAPGDQISSIDANGGNAQVLLGQTLSRASICTLSEALARHPRRIIASDANLLKKTKPILFFEYYPKCAELIGQNAFPVFTTLSSLGYSMILIYQNLGRYFICLTLDQQDALQDLHHFISDLGGYFDVVAFHKEDLEIAINIRAAEYANRRLKEESNNGNAR
jgi:hypothetical protein